MNKACFKHKWVSNSGYGGVPVFRFNSHMGKQPIMHARCCECGSRTWFTEDQWEAQLTETGRYPNERTT